MCQFYFVDKQMPSNEVQEKSLVTGNFPYSLVCEVKTRCKLLPLKFFTLIELLVVIAIIAILASMLLPTLKIARDTAKQIKCASNMKQIGTSFSLYHSDYAGYYPPNFWGSVAFGAWRRGWPSLVAPYLGLDLGEGQNGYPLMPNRPTVFQCPSMPWSHRDSYFSCHYGYNTSALGRYNYKPYTNWGVSHPGYPVRTSQLKSPTKQMSHIDIYYYANAPTTCNKGRWGAEYENFFAYRHRNGSVLLYADGHAKYQRKNFITGGLTGFALHNSYPINMFLRN